MVNGEQRNATVVPVLDGKEIRRASPLWLHPHPQPSGAWHLRSLAFLAEWLPRQANLRVRSGRRNEPVGKPSQQEVEEFVSEWFPAEDG